MSTRTRAALVALAGCALVAAGSSMASAERGGQPLDDARYATAAYHDVSNARAAGYGELTDAAGIACIDNPAGGMGIHYVKGALVGDPEINALAPEALVYRPDADGNLHLAALEYVVLADAWHSAYGKQPPKLFGQKFELVPAGNRYGLPPFYELHVWAWETNTNGLFADWNPAVVCP